MAKIKKRLDQHAKDVAAIRALLRKGRRLLAELVAAQERTDGRLQGLNPVLALATCALILTAALPALAHHSFSSEYDESNPVTLEGVVTRIDWENPHVHYYIDVAQLDGTVVNWSCETGGPKRLEMHGWRRDSLKAGDKVVVHAFPSKDGSHYADGRKVTFPNGRTISSTSRN